MRAQSTWDETISSEQVWEKVHAACDAFSSSWRSGCRPAVEQFVSEDEVACLPVLVLELLTLERKLKDEASATLVVQPLLKRAPIDTETSPFKVAPLLRSRHAVLPSSGVDESLMTRIEYDPAAEETPPQHNRLTAKARDTDNAKHSVRASDAERPSQIIGARYHISHEIGKGSFATVYLAEDELMRRPVALKMPRPDGPLALADMAAFTREARTLAQLDHPNIVPVYDVGMSEDCRAYVVSKFVAGPDLHELLRQRAFTPMESAKIVAQIARALQHAHSRGFVHRDVKPANILLDVETNTPLLSDFGLALGEEKSESKRGALAGTAAYMAPEQVRGEIDALDGRTDIWALGAVFYEMLVKRRAFAGTHRLDVFNAILRQTPIPPRRFNPDVPVELQRICLRCLSKRPSDRYATANELADELEHFASTNNPSLPDRRPRRRWFAKTVIALLVLDAAIFAWRMQHPHREPPLSLTGFVLSFFLPPPPHRRGDDRHSQRRIDNLPTRTPITLATNETDSNPERRSPHSSELLGGSFWLASWFAPCDRRKRCPRGQLDENLDTPESDGLPHHRAEQPFALDLEPIVDAPEPAWGTDANPPVIASRRPHQLPPVVRFVNNDSPGQDQSPAVRPTEIW